MLPSVTPPVGLPARKRHGRSADLDYSNNKTGSSFKGLLRETESTAQPFFVAKLQVSDAKNGWNKVRKIAGYD